MKRFSILITTKDRIKDLEFTLGVTQSSFNEADFDLIICDDGSTDGTFEIIKSKYPKVQIIRNEKSKGLIFSRNRLMALVKTEFAISIDDDLHFLTNNALALILNYFKENQNVAVIGFRIFWSLFPPDETSSDEIPLRVRSFAGGAHAWRMAAWKSIQEYPHWFIFYGEEDFASYQLFKKKWEIHYLPEILVHHRVDVKSRKKNTDYALRLQRSLRAGWYLMFLFYPIVKIPKLLAYSLWIQLKLKVFKGDWRALQAILLALVDLVISIPRIFANSNRLSRKEYEEYQKIPGAKIYWKPNQNQKV